MTIHFIGAGPGAPDLITLRGAKLIAECPVCLYAGSLVPAEVIATAPQGALVMDTAAMVLEEIIAVMQRAHEEKKSVARVHSGDPSLYGAIAEQMRALDKLGIDYDICPGVPAYAAAAALLQKELTLADVSQTIILTRTAVRASSMPANEDLVTLGKSGATLAIHLSINNLAKVVKDLTPNYGADCPVAVVYRATWPDQKIITGTLQDIRDKVKKENITRTALILVGRVLGSEDFSDSHLYHKDHSHVLREKK
ncbi:MAG: precorrin-4 C(11)-methyltransferase [Hydrotalea sp.]|nr:precorrin-4 C(11)-methyltransferase [Hydrotalea sp.]